LELVINLKTAKAAGRDPVMRSVPLWESTQAS